MNKGDYVSWATRKGRYVGSLESINNAGKHQVFTSSGGTETVEATSSKTVGKVRVYVNNEDGTFTQSDRVVSVLTKMLRKIKKPNVKAQEKASASVKKTLKDKQVVEKAPKTNFPNRGDDQKVSLANSEYKQFPLAEAQKLKDEWPQIWKRGGNILGNTQFTRLKKVKQSGVKTPTDEKAVRLREAWSARHYKDYRLAGVVAQIKWLTTGSRGISHMRKVISDEKARLRK
jgi:hypothetical protein